VPAHKLCLDSCPVLWILSGRESAARRIASRHNHYAINTAIAVLPTGQVLSQPILTDWTRSAAHFWLQHLSGVTISTNLEIHRRSSPRTAHLKQSHVALHAVYMPPSVSWACKTYFYVYVHIWKILAFGGAAFLLKGLFSTHSDRKRWNFKVAPNDQRFRTLAVLSSTNAAAMSDFARGGYLRPKMGMVFAWSQGMGPQTGSFQA